MKKIIIDNTTFIIDDNNKVSIRQVLPMKFGRHNATVGGKLMEVPVRVFSRFINQVEKEGIK